MRATCASMSTWPLPPPTDELKRIAANSDGIVLMNYDEHEANSDPGPVASQDWFVGNLQRVLKIVPKEKIICAVGNYGYDWTLSIPDPKDRRHPKPQVLDTEDLLGLRCLAARLRRRRRPRPRLRLPQSALRVHRRGQQSAPRGLVSRWRFAAGRDARRPRPGPADLCPVAAGRGRQLAVEHLGQAHQSRLAAGAGLGAARARRGHRGRRRHSARDRTAAAGQAHRERGHRRA